MQTIAKNMEREVARQKLTADEREAALKRIRLTPRRDLAACDLVVEAATEKFEIKAEIFRDLETICRPEVILASNTSSISITKLAGVTKQPGQSYWHALFQPRAADETGRGHPWTGDLERDLLDREGARGKARQDAGGGERAPGFVSNRVLMPLINEAIYTVMEGVATPRRSMRCSSWVWRIPWGR